MTSQQKSRREREVKLKKKIYAFSIFTKVRDVDVFKPSRVELIGEWETKRKI